MSFLLYASPLCCQRNFIQRQILKNSAGKIYTVTRIYNTFQKFDNKNLYIKSVFKKDIIYEFNSIQPTGSI